MGGAGKIERVGTHEVEFLPPRTVRISWLGDVTSAEAQAIAQLIFDHTGTLTRSNYVTDVSRLGKMPTDACEALLSRPPRQGAEACSFRLAFAGANVRTKMIMSVLIAAARITGRDALASRFFSSVDDAIAWALDDVTDVALSSTSDLNDSASS